MKYFKQFTFSLLALLFSTFLFTSCKDEDDKQEEPQPAAVTIEIASPTAGASFGLNETVHINAQVTAAKEIHGYEVTIRNKSKNNEVVFHKTGHDHATSLHIHEHWDNTLADHCDMELEIKVVKDHNGGTETKTVSFHCHPM
ncbi:MAG: hypothetical protein LPJ89_03250 [Hymenobacteraceae bacterium]|nr:hypothetical protein [Hymenobacteraceae bacterium]MDX5395889.1 hypothetical protein [Hymenobacteraceae bacterium]MDX5442779.1 hypothetical protein [Hymenobacteraceae bacterium]MDX5511944.1 hypothetical protein [Hymenobacteraceae bacterium]